MLLLNRDRMFWYDGIWSGSDASSYFKNPIISWFLKFRHPSRLESFSSWLGQISYQHSVNSVIRVDSSLSRAGSADSSRLKLLRVDSSRPLISAQWVRADSNYFKSTRPDCTSTLSRSESARSSGSELARTTSSRLLVVPSRLSSMYPRCDAIRSRPSDRRKLKGSSRRCEVLSAPTKRPLHPCRPSHARARAHARVMLCITLKLSTHGEP